MNVTHQMPESPKTQVDEATPLTDKNFEPREKPARDPSTIKNKGQLFQALIKDFPEGIVDKEDCLRWIGKSETEIVDPAAEYIAVAEKIKKA